MLYMLRRIREIADFTQSVKKLLQKFDYKFYNNNKTLPTYKIK